ncbi:MULTISPECIES: hypothetical protein [Streptomyces]|uniref:Tetratricopeptide repeat protein n=2 Tax=Streptomyces TaxID=1883 RepID=A0A2U9PB01_STRAS|nr:hypothetical protein [Streptomyces actuosus]AWT46673.1 hypothetical protein DMT42_33210 [Streptomyces actuosus]MBM4823399.1 hypothetical protein [Streptomyces actuosus]
MGDVGKIDQDAVLRARATLLASDTPSRARQVEAYRVLAEVSPESYLPKLAKALVSYGYEPEFRDRPEARLALNAEAVAVARRIDPDDPRRTEVLVDTLRSWQFELFRAGRRAEALAVCGEMAEVGRDGFARGQVTSPEYGAARLAVVLAEEGRHGEAAELLGRFAARARAESPWSAFWDGLAHVAELEAAGRRGEALDAFADLVAADCAELESGRTSLAIPVWLLVHHSRMLDAAGRPAEARAARARALGLLTELDATGERRTWGNMPAWWVTLLALSGRAAEPGYPAPAFGRHFTDWSPDLRQTYVDGIAPLEAEVAALRRAADADPDGPHLPELLERQRRLTVRSAVHREHRTHSVLKPLRPLFAEGVALARRLAARADPRRGRDALARALTDRAMFLLAGRQYGEAYDDFREVVALLD